MFIGPDEADATGVPIAISFDTELNGGFGPAQITLPIVDGVDETRARMFAKITIADATDGRTYYIGRVSGVSLSATQISISCEGMAKHLEDDETAHEIYYDRDLTHWEGPTISRELYLKEGGHGGYAVTGASTEADIEAPALTTSFSGPFIAGSLPRSEAWYDAQGCRIAFVDYAWKKSALVSTEAEKHYEWEAFTATSSTTGLGGVTTGNLRAAGPGAAKKEASGERYACVNLRNAGVGGESGAEYKIQWTLLAIVGTHGIPLQGTVSAPDNGRGVLGSDAAAHAVGKFAPLVKFTTGALGSIEPTSFAIPQLEFRDDTTVRAMIEQIAIYGGDGYLPMDWGVYELFFMRSPGRGRVWRVRRDQTATTNDSGPDASERLNGVKVAYDDGTGKRLTVGPIGSGADAEYTELEDIDPTNPANQDGARHWRLFDAGVTTKEGAVLIGQLILNKANTILWRGTVSVVEFATTEEGETLPAALIRSGDEVVVEDEEDTRRRRIVNTSYDSATQALSASCGAPPDYLDVLMARNAASIQSRI